MTDKTAIVLDGKALAQVVRAQLKQEAEAVSVELGRKPCLAVVLVGDDPASQVYVKSKSKLASQCGIVPRDVLLSADCGDVALQDTLRSLCLDNQVDGVLLQLPLPQKLNEFEALCAIDPACDVDGLHPVNQGLLVRHEDTFVPCTPAGVMALIDHARVALGASSDLSGLHAVVVGRSVLVGKPVGMLLLERHCTVTYCHSRTRNLAKQCRQADILVIAVGRPGVVGAGHIKSGAIVIDVGINRLPDGAIVGDVLYQESAKIAGAITPVPGGVGPMTIAMLLKNTIKAARAKVRF